MKKRGYIGSVLLGMAGLSFCVFAAVAGETLTITTAGEYPLTAGETYDSVKNAASDGEVKLVSTGEAVADDAIPIGRFDATVNGARTVFNGGYWDFGATDRTTNFFSYGQKLANRATTLDNGAKIVGVGSLFLAGASGTNNVLALTGASSMTVSRLTMGAATTENQRSRLTVEDGSSFVCNGDLCLSAGLVGGESAALSRTGNRLTVTGEGSSITVKGLLNIGGPYDEGKTLMGTRGGNTFEVLDGASADLKNINIASTTRAGSFNRVVFGEDAKVLMTSLDFGSNRYPTYPGTNAIEILAGAVVTNSGVFAFGGTRELGAYSCVVSNASFTVGSVTKQGTVCYFMPAPHSTFVLSGKNAEFKVVSGFTGLNAVFWGRDCSFIVENGADYTWPVGAFAYTVPVTNDTLLVRNGATVTVPGGFCTGASNHSKDGFRRDLNNAVIVENDAVFKCDNGSFSVSGRDGRMVVSNATAWAYKGKVIVGHDGSATSGSNQAGTNCLLSVCGTRPMVRSDKGTYIWHGSKLRVNLPREGYETGYATGDCPHVRAGTVVTFGMGGRFELSGAEDMFKYHQDHGIKANYVLLQGEAGITIDEDNLAEIQAVLPERMTITMRTLDAKPSVVLSVKPYRGLLMLVR